MTIFGTAGLIILLLSYVLWVVIQTKYFLYLDLVASILLVIHSILINDATFVFANGFISLMIAIKIYKGGLK